jgi:CubicO group peptidase (beta-lactamase class C family)
MTLLFSATKGLVSTIFLKMYAEGLFNYDNTVCSWWPECGQTSKEIITIKQFLSHKAGLVLLDIKLDIQELADFDTIAQSIATVKPMGNPGDYQAYQAATIGFYRGELVRRIDRNYRSLGRYFQEGIATPLGLGLYIGLLDTVPDTALSAIKMINHSTALFNLNKMPPDLKKVMLDLNAPFMKSMSLIKGYDPNKRGMWAVLQPSENGFGTAEACARLYGILADGGKEIGLSKSARAVLYKEPEQPLYDYHDQVMNIETRYGIGFMKPDPLFTYVPNPRAFGFLGATGTFAFGDQEKGIGYAYITRKMGYYGINDPREKSIREALYRAIERMEAL